MYLSFNSSVDKSKCSGCGACVQLCPKKCIELTEDNNGFLFPVVDNTQCVECHMCEKVCPIMHKPEILDRIEAPYMIAAKSKDKNEIVKASSGGAFGSIVEVLSSEGKWTVYGAVLNEQLKVVHDCRNTGENMDCFHKSKYVQSNLKNTYKDIEEMLSNRGKVVFSGTPCQVAGLINYLSIKKINRDGLFCIDLICHGVPSQKLFDRYIEEEEKVYHNKISYVEFRHKIKKGIRRKWDSRNLLLKLENGKEVNRNRYTSRYLRAYHAFLFYRESCHKCPYANEKRNGDITIADFWGIKKFYQKLDVDNGISLVQANTEIGKVIVEKLDGYMEIYPIERDAYLQLTSGAMVQSSPANRNRAQFLQYVENHSFFSSVDKFIPKYKEFVKVEIMRRLDPKIRKKVKQMMRKNS